MVLVTVHAVPSLLRLGKSTQDQEHKFLVDDTMTVAQFLFWIRRKLYIAQHPSDSVFLFCGQPPQFLPCATDTIGDVFQKFSVAGVLHITPLAENTFGHPASAI